MPWYKWSWTNYQIPFSQESISEKSFVLKNRTKLFLPNKTAEIFIKSQFRNWVNILNFIQYETNLISVTALMMTDILNKYDKWNHHTLRICKASKISELCYINVFKKISKQWYLHIKIYLFIVSIWVSVWVSVCIFFSYILW